MKEIKEIIESYRDLPPNYMGINDLIHKRQRLAGHYFNLTENLGTLKRIHNANKAIYETKKAFTRVQSMASGKSATEASLQSRASTAGEYRDVQHAEGEYLELFYQYKGVDAVLNALTQDIANLRNELSKANL